MRDFGNIYRSLSSSLSGWFWGWFLFLFWFLLLWRSYGEEKENKETAALKAKLDVLVTALQNNEQLKDTIIDIVKEATPSGSTLQLLVDQLKSQITNMENSTKKLRAAQADLGNASTLLAGGGTTPDTAATEEWSFSHAIKTVTTS